MTYMSGGQISCNWEIGSDTCEVMREKSRVTIQVWMLLMMHKFTSEAGGSKLLVKIQEDLRTETCGSVLENLEVL